MDDDGGMLLAYQLQLEEQLIELEVFEKENIFYLKDWERLIDLGEYHVS